MMGATLSAMQEHLPEFSFPTGKTAVNCHHNYVERENHFEANVWVTRKGAVRAREGDLGIIPGSMGTGSFIVRGKGNPESFCSCSHGAGRSMSRTEARKTISLEQHRDAMRGIEARLDADVLDESPAAYKDISAVMAAQGDLIEVVHRLRQIVNVKG
jgi:tRNA-splicing ligase RtcB